MANYETDDYFDLEIDGKQVRSAKKALSPERQESIRRQFDTKKAGSVFNASETMDAARSYLEPATEFQKQIGSVFMAGPLAAAGEPGRHVVNGAKAGWEAAKTGAGYALNLASDFAHDRTGGLVGEPLKTSLGDKVAANGVNLTPQAKAELEGLPVDAAPEQQQPPNYVMAGPNSSPSSQVSQMVSGATREGGTVAPRRASDFGAKGINAAFDAQANAQRSAADVGAQRAAEEYGYQQEKTAILEAEAKKSQAFEARRKSINDDQTQKLEAIQQRLSSLDGNVDPQRFWKGKDTSSKIAAAVGIFLGGLGGGPNRALDIVNNAVNQDIEAQQQSFQNAMAKGKTEFELQSNLYGQHLRALGDEQLASLATRDAMLGVVEQKLTTTGAKFKTPELQANLEKSLADVQMMRAKVQSELMEKRDASAARWAQISMQREEIQARQKLAETKALAGKNGGAGQNLPAGEAAKVGELDAGINILNDLRRNYLKKTGTFSGLAQHVPGTDAASFNDDRKTAAQVVGGQIEGGKLTEDDFARYYSDFMPSPGDSRERALAKMANLEAKLQAKKKAALSAFNNAGFDVSGFPKQISSFKAD